VDYLSDGINFSCNSRAKHSFYRYTYLTLLMVKLQLSAPGELSPTPGTVCGLLLVFCATLRADDSLWDSGWSELGAALSAELSGGFVYCATIWAFHRLAGGYPNSR
jgi:hypothetical protein